MRCLNDDVSNVIKISSDVNRLIAHICIISKISVTIIRNLHSYVAPLSLWRRHSIRTKRHWLCGDAACATRAHPPIAFEIWQLRSRAFRCRIVPLNLRVEFTNCDAYAVNFWDASGSFGLCFRVSRDSECGLILAIPIFASDTIGSKGNDAGLTNPDPSAVLHSKAWHTRG